MTPGEFWPTRLSGARWNGLVKWARIRRRTWQRHTVSHGLPSSFFSLFPVNKTSLGRVRTVLNDLETANPESLATVDIELVRHVSGG